MKGRSPAYLYHVLTIEGQALFTATRGNIMDVLRELVDKTGVQWGYQTIQRSVRASGFWAAGYRPPGADARPLLVVVERLSAPAHAPPPP